MLNKIIAGVLNWLVVSIIMPAMYFVYDVFKLRKENKELKKAIEEIKSAKTKPQIDASIDNLP
jgi:TM2 domain-containing membrane protein YozV